MFNPEKMFNQPPQENKEGGKESKEKIEENAAAKRRKILDGILDNVFTKEGEPKDKDNAEGLAVKGLRWLNRRSNLLRAATGMAEASVGTSAEGKKLSSKERLVRGLAGVGSALVWGYKADQYFPPSISDEESIEVLEEKVEPWLREMAEYELKGETEKAVREAAGKKEKEGEKDKADILNKSADFMKKNPDIVEDAETDIRLAIENIQ